MLWWIAQNAVVSGLLALVVTIVCRLGRLSPAVKHALWLLVLLKLVTPPFAWYQLPHWVDDMLSTLRAPRANDDALREFSRAERSGLSAEPVEASVDSVEALRANRSETVGDNAIEVLPASPAREYVTTHESLTPELDEPSDPVGERFEFDVERDDRQAVARPYERVYWLALAVWLTGAVSLASIQTIRLIRLWRLMRHAATDPSQIEELVQRVAARLKIRPPEVIVVPVLCSPLVCALGRPRLLWPAALSEQLPREAREAVLLHELAHLRRRDHWIAWLEMLSGWAWWFNPVYWYARHQLRENAEMACDAWVVALLPSGRRAYAQALIEVTEFVSSAAAASPAVAMGNVARKTLERRLTMILRERISYRVPFVGAALIGLSLLAVLPGWSPGQVAEKKPVSQSTAQDKLPVDNRDLPASPGLPASSDAAQGTVGPKASTADDFGVLVEPGTRADFVQQPSSGDLAADRKPNEVASDVSSGEDRIRQVEAKLAQLLDEVRALRGNAPKVLNEQRLPDAQSNYRHTRLWGGAQGNGQPVYSAFVAQHTAGGMPPGSAVETLTRARYKLPEATVAALSTFIKEHVNADIDGRADGDTLTVIASQGDQARIAGFVELLKKPEALPGLPGAPMGGPNSQPGVNSGLR